MSIRIKLVGCERFSLMGELFEKGFFYDLSEDKARTLLKKTEERGRPYFVRVETPVENEEVEITEEESEEIGGVKITRKRGRPRKNPIIKERGDTSSLDDEDRTRDQSATVVTEDGIEV